MKGSIGTTSILEVLQMLGITNREGILYVRNGGEILNVGDRAKIYIKNGKVCFISIEGTKTLLDLARNIVGSDPELKEEEQVLKVCRDDRLKALVEDIITDRLIIINTWKEGEYEFFDEKVDLPEIYPISTLILKVASALDETSEKIEISPFSIPEIKPKRKVEEKLSPDEWKVLCWIDGKRSVLEISELSSLSFFKTVNAIKGLERKGLIELQEPIGTPDLEGIKRGLEDLYREGKFSEVVKAVDRVLSLFPDDKDMILLKAESLYRLGRFDDALRVLNPLFVESQDPEIKRFYAYCLVGMGRFKESLGILREIGDDVMAEIVMMLLDNLKGRKSLV